MPAGVVKGARCAIMAAHNEDGIVANLQREIASGFRDLAIMAGEQPFPVMNRFEIEAMKFRVAVEFSAEGEAGAAAIEFGQHLMSRIHVSIPRDHRCDRWTGSDMRDAKVPRAAFCQPAKAPLSIAHRDPSGSLEAGFRA